MSQMPAVKYVNCNLTYLLEAKGWDIDEAAKALGDSSLRLYRVLEGLEPFGRTATLAALALKNNLPFDS